MPFLRGGGIFIPTSRQYALGEEVFMLLSLMDDPNRIAVQGKVVWITPEGVQGNRTQGIGVQFTQDETGSNAKSTIEKILGESLAWTRATHTMGSGSQRAKERSQQARLRGHRPHGPPRNVRRFALPPRFS